LTPKENYLAMLRGEIPDCVPSYCEPYTAVLEEGLTTPGRAPGGPIVTAPGIICGALPKPGRVPPEGTAKRREVIRLPDVSGRNRKGYCRGDALKKNADTFVPAASP